MLRLNSENVALGWMDVLDPHTLASLRGLDEEDDLLHQLIELFLTDAPARMARMREAIARADWRALGDYAHSLKGSCGTLGALRMAELCDWLERHDHRAAAAAAEMACEELAMQYERVRTALERERQRVRG
jgi:HPt (histidine-containing phosphotransfer) domain-containing protein